MAYLVAQGDGPGLIALLEPADEAQRNAFWAHGRHICASFRKPTWTKRVMCSCATDCRNCRDAPLPICMRRGADQFGAQRPAEALRIADLLAQEFPRRPSAWYLRAEALRVNDRDLKRRARCPVWQSARRPMIRWAWARVGLAAIFTNLGEKPKACAMMEKIFARSQAVQNWQKATDVFPMLAAWSGRRGPARWVSSGNGRASAGNGACR